MLLSMLLMGLDERIAAQERLTRREGLPSLREAGCQGAGLQLAGLTVRLFDRCAAAGDAEERKQLVVWVRGSSKPVLQ